jgi:predicted regulator of Ras-like GTPase activity (Roadblock/LC7/MglB family)
MEDILRDINAVVGVTGSFVCDDDGRVLAQALPDIFDAALLSPVGRTLAQTIAGLETSNRRKVGDIDLLYNQGRLIVKNLGEGCLCVLCVRRINVPLLNLTANVAAKKLSERLREARPVPARVTTPRPAPKPEPAPAPKPELAPAPAARATPVAAVEAEAAPQETAPQPEEEPVRRMTRAEMMAATLRGR